MKKLSILLTALIVISVFSLSCSNNKNTNLVRVVAKDYYFNMNPTIPSGWSTFRLVNDGHATHFFYLTLLPDGATFQDYTSEVVSAFAATWDTLQAGASKEVAGNFLGSLLPKWYASAKYMGGSGLIARGDSTEVTLKLIPGNYVMECYMKTEEGKFHGELGMIRPVTVTNEISKMKEPDDADIEINLTNANMEVKGNISSGEHIVAVHFKEQPEFGLGNDVHLVRLKKDTDLNDVINWMDWMNINGLRTPAPAEFLGGTQEMPVGNTSYFKINLTPGRYAWISETFAKQGVVKEFTVD